MSDSQASGLDLSTLLASSIHDMKNGLSLVLQTVESLDAAAEAPVAQRRERYHSLRHEALRLNRQLLQLLTLYRAQEQRLSLAAEEYPVADLLEDCALEYGPALTDRGIAIAQSCAPTLLACCDPDLVAGVLGNALNNALRFARRRVRLAAGSWSYPGGRGVCLSVADDGPGFAASCLSSLRDGTGPGAQAGPQDTGLGLLFCARVAAEHRNRGQAGRIVCDNGGLAGGGRFRLYLP